MNNNENPNNNPGEDISKQLGEIGMQTGKKAGKVAGKAGKKLGKKAGKALLKLGAKAGKAVGKALLATLKALSPYILAILGVLLIIVLAYFILFEFRGPEQQYSYNYDNEIEKNDNGYFSINDGNLSYENKTIYSFYKYFSGQSYSQIIGDDNTKLISPDDEDAVKDYHGREQGFNLSSDLLFSLDEYMFQGKFKYPEQFIKPVNYDPDTLTLKDLTDDDGFVIVEAEEKDDEGKKTGEKIISVREYGIGSVFKYGEYERKLTVDGTYYQEDVWDSSSQSVVQVPITETFSKIMDDYPEDIHLIDKAITFVGDFEYEYKEEAIRFEELKPGGSSKENEPYKKYHYDTYEEPYDCTTNDLGVEKCKYRSHKLYKYRDEESAVFETMPRGTVNAEEKEDNDRYLRDYLYNFEAYVPNDVINEFDFGDRVGTFIDVDFEVGAGTNSKSYRKSLGYLNIITEMCEKYGIEDPLIIVAMMSQESGGDKNINKDGLMQVTGTSRTGTTATGEKVTITASGDAKLDPRTNIEMGVIEFKSRMDNYEGDVLKALQSYNFGQGGLNYIRDKYPESWMSLDWMNHREESREYYGYKYWGEPSRSADDKDPAKKSYKVYGDTHYVEHVLQYYSGESLNDLENHDTDAPKKKGFFSGIGNWFMSFITTHEEDEEYPIVDYIYHSKYTLVDDILKMAKAMDEETLFSETTHENLSFWDKGFVSSLQTQGMSLDEFNNLVPNSDGYYTPTKIANVKNFISSPFGMRTLRGKTRMHQGIDIGIPEGTRLYAVSDGTVEIAKKDGSKGGGYGYYIKIRHTDGTSSLYGHMNDAKWYGNSSTFIVEQGQSVKGGDFIGFSGNTGSSTGAHLHFEFHLANGPIDPYHVLVGDLNANND